MKKTKDGKERAKDSSSLLKRIAYPLVTLALIIIGFQIGIQAYKIPQIILPTPTDSFRSLFAYGGLLVGQSLLTLESVVGGFLIGAIFGITLAILMFYVQAIRDAIYPLLVAFQVIPRIALAPLFLIWFGFGLEYKIMITFFVAFFPVIVSSVGGFMAVEPEELDLFRSLNASSAVSFRKLLLPTALPEIFGGLKVSITLAMVGAIVAEFVAGNKGVGYLIIVANQTLNTPLIFAGLIVIGVMGLGLYAIIEVAERLALPWFYLERKRK